ncbi:MAG: threonine aldolase [Deltaproteobacteria bacterium RBG_13_61_14]|nr:MAG: threonine aldolase [Deltaproteobacteria bacterium RBG_13_61_14]
MKTIDLRSDTVTRPTPGMRRAMASAEVGDDVYGEDPTVNALEARAAERMGKEAAVFMPSGTMANQVAIRAHTRHGDSVIIGENAHAWLYESGAPAALSGVLTIVAGRGGTFTAEDALASAKGGNVHLAPTSLIMMENTHNSGGGIVFPQKDLDAIGALAKAWGFKTHLDGARIFNAAVKTGLSPQTIARPADSVSFCLSKGLGAPVGSVLCGSKEFIARARRFRKMFGGGMRQAGILAAAGLYALDHHVERLAEDHRNARRLAEGLAGLEGIAVDLAKVETNMTFLEVTRPGLDAFTYAGRLKQLGVLINPLGKSRLRAVTHLDVSRDDIETAIPIFQKALQG